MRTAILTRSRGLSNAEGTFGGLLVQDEAGKGILRCVTLELPWRDNKTGLSCIPPGTYPAAWRNSPKHGDCYHVDGVPGRTDIEIHPANLAGDVESGFVSQLLGCISPGKATAIFAAGTPPAGDKPQRGVTGSRLATSELADALGKQPFTLTIRWDADA